MDLVAKMKNTYEHIKALRKISLMKNTLTHSNEGHWKDEKCIVRTSIPLVSKHLNKHSFSHTVDFNTI